MQGIVLSVVLFAAPCMLWAAPGETAGVARVPYTGRTPADFEAFANRLGKSDWPTPATIGQFNGEGTGGEGIRYAYWAPAAGAPKGVVVHFNGRTEFIERNIYTYRDLTQRGYAVWSLDWRGQGFSARSLPELQHHHIESFDQYVKDVSYFLDNIVHLKNAIGKKILLAHSMGGQIALRYLLTDQGRDSFDKVVLSSPLVKLPSDNVAVRGGNWLKRFLGFSESCVGDKKPEWSSNFTGSACAVARSGKAESSLSDRKDSMKYSNDFMKLAETDCMIESSVGARGADKPDLRLACPTSGWFHAAAQSTDEVLTRAQKLRTPILMIRTVEDHAVDNAGQEILCNSKIKITCEKIESTDAEPVGHELLIEREPIRQRFLKAFDQFVNAS